jgi:hypothetical protein
MRQFIRQIDRQIDRQIGQIAVYSIDITRLVDVLPHDAFPGI